MKIIKNLITIALILVLTLNFSSALFINSVTSPNLKPGQEGKIFIELENTLDRDARDVSISLDFSNLPFIPVGSSQQSDEEIEEGDEEDFVFTIRAANNIIPGDYEIPYKVIFTKRGSDDEQTREGTIGVFK